MKLVGIAKKVPLTALIDILVKFEKKGVEFVDLNFYQENTSDNIADRVAVERNKEKSKFVKEKKSSVIRNAKDISKDNGALTEYKLKLLLNNV